MRRAKLSVRQDCHNNMHVWVGEAEQADVTAIEQLILLAAKRGGYQHKGSPDKVIYL